MTRILKPDSGETLVLQDEGGSAVLTIDTDGDIQIANNIDTGTIGGNVTFPAGHVLQVVQNEVTETNSLTTAYVNLYEVSIQLKSNSSDIFGFFYFQYRLYANAGFGVKIYRNNSATVTTSHTAVWTKNVADGAGAPYTWYNDDNSTDQYGVGSINPKDSLSGFSAGDTLYYALFAREYDANSVEMPFNESEDGFFSSTLIEVQK